MKNWNKIGKIKALILGLVASINLLVPTVNEAQNGFLMILMPLFFASIAIPFISKVNAGLGRKITKPNWNDSPLTFQKPLTMFDYFAYFFLTVGLSMLIGTGIKFHTLNNWGLTCVSFGIGIFVGIWLALKWIKTK